MIEVFDVCVDILIWISNVFNITYKEVIFDYQPTDLAAAITVDRGNFYTSLREEGKL